MTLKYTPSLQEILKKTCEISTEFGHSYIGSEHLLLSILRTPNSGALEILSSRGADESQVVQCIREISGGRHRGGRAECTPSVKNIIEGCSVYAERMNHDSAGSVHLLHSIISDDGCLALRILEDLGLSILGIRNDIDNFFDALPQSNKENVAESQTSALEKYGTDLCALAKADNISDISGRTTETERLIYILCRKSKNNPCLIGEPGVGKTAIVEGLARKISDEEVPEALLGKRIISIDMSQMISGAKYRGEFEERLKEVLRLAESHDDIILFIDEIHTVVGAGSAEGALDAANIIKPALSRGRIQVIGATTFAEYRKNIESDSALERRFQPITVNEPSVSETLDILKSIRPSYEAHHDIKITDDALKAAVELSVRYVNDRFLPDKAIDLLDEACSAVTLKFQNSKNTQYALRKELKNLFSQKEFAVLSGDLEKARQIRKKEIQTENKLEKEVSKASKKPNLRSENIADVITRQTGIPVNKLMESDSKKLLSLSSELSSKIHGQDEAIRILSKAIRRSRIGLHDPSRPIGSFIFAGASGVGKTGLAKALSVALFGSENSMVRIDMSEYMEQHSISKLIGSPPGYVGYGEGGILTQKVRRCPYCVILLDEIEKAHPDIFNILLQILDDGRLTDSTGRYVNFKNTVIIMTTNIGVTSLSHNAMGFGTTDQRANEQARIISSIKKTFSPEFLNRIDNVIVFRKLDIEDMKTICRDMLKELISRVKNIGIDIEFADSAVEFLASISAKENLGARPLKRNISSLVEDVISEKMLMGEIKKGDILDVSANTDTLVIKNRGCT